MPRLPILVGWCLAALLASLLGSACASAPAPKQGHSQILIHQNPWVGLDKGQAPAPESGRPLPERKRRVLAVMEIENRSKKVTDEVSGNGTDYLRSQLGISGRFIVVDRGRQEQALRAMIREQKKESYAACYDDSCQIPLGQALAADTILRSGLTFFGGQCMLSCELVDLAKEASTGGSIEKFDCTEPGLALAIERVAKTLGVEGAP